MMSGIIGTAVIMKTGVTRIAVVPIRALGQPTQGMDNHHNQRVTLLIKADLAAAMERRRRAVNTARYSLWG